MDTNKSVKVIDSLKWLRNKDSWREGIMIHDDHAEVRKRICDNAITLLKEQQKRIEKLESDKGWDESPDMMGKW